MRLQAACALAALFLTSPRSLASTEASGQVLAFTSARSGTSLFEPRMQIASLRRLIAAGDALEFELLAPQAFAEELGVEIVFLDGRRSRAPRFVDAAGWRHVRIPLDAFVNLETERLELVARGGTSDEIGFHVDDVVLTHANGETTVLFAETLANGARIARDDRRQSGVALVGVSSGFAGARTLIDPASIREPWHAYDLANLRRSADGDLAAGGPLGGLLVGPCVPMHFATPGEHESLSSAGQKFLFEPLEGGRFYTVWFALSTTDGEALSTRYVAFGDSGERRSVGLVVPKRGEVDTRATDLGTCWLVASPIASLVPLRGLEVPSDPRLRVHAITFQWHKDGASDERFHAAWLREQATTPSGLARDRADALLRWADNRELGPMFVDGVVDEALEREMFTALLRGPSAEFDKLLSKETQRQIAVGAPLKQTRLAIEDVRDGRAVVRVDPGADPEAMVRAFAEQSGSGALVLEGEPALLRQAPQIMTGLGRTTVLFEKGPRIARWMASDDSSVIVLSPFRVIEDTREFADLQWRQWLKAVALNIAPADLLLAVDGSSRARAEAARIVRRLSSLACVPNVSFSTAEDYVEQVSQRSGDRLPTYTPVELAPIVSAEALQRAESAPATRRAAQALSRFAMLAAPARADGSEYPAAAIDALRQELRALGSNADAALAERIVARAEVELARELDILARGAPTLGKGTPIVAFNALPWSRRAFVELDSGSGVLFGADGSALPWQKTAGGSRLFAVDLPGLGYQVLRGLRADDVGKLEARDQVRVNGFSARNGRIAFTIDPALGAVTSLTLVDEKQELLSSPARLVGEAWKVESAEFTEKGPLRAVARLVLSDGDRRADLEFRLESRSEALEVIARIRGEPALFRIRAAPAASHAVFGVPFGSANATPLLDGSPARHRITDWAATSDANFGIGILAGTLATVIVETDGVAPELAGGTQTRFALVPFDHGWRKAALAGRASELATPPVLIATDAHEGARSARHSFLNIVRFEGFERRSEGAKCGVVMTALEPSLDGAAYDVRLAETNGAEASLALEIDRPIFGAALVTLRGEVIRELRIEDQRVVLDIGPNRIETVRIRLRP